MWPSKMKLQANNKKSTFDRALKLLPRIRLRSVTGSDNKTKIAPNIAITPPSLSWIDRNIA